MEWKPRLVLSSVHSAIREDEIQSVKMTPYKHSRGGRMIQTYNKVKIYDHKKEHLVGGFFFPWTNTEFVLKQKGKARYTYERKQPKDHPPSKPEHKPEVQCYWKRSQKAPGMYGKSCLSFRVSGKTGHQVLRGTRSWLRSPQFTRNSETLVNSQNSTNKAQDEETGAVLEGVGVFLPTEREKKHWGLCFIQNTVFF